MILSCVCLSGLTYNSSGKDDLSEKATLGTYLRRGSYIEGEIRFEYYGGPMPGIFPTSNPPAPPYEATIRVMPHRFHELFACAIEPHASPDDVDLRRYSGSLSITLKAFPQTGMPTKSLKILFFYNRKEVWFDGKFWDIDDSFWSWLNRNFPFSGINIHLDKKSDSTSMSPSDK